MGKKEKGLLEATLEEVVLFVTDVLYYAALATGAPTPASMPLEDDDCEDEE